MQGNLTKKGFSKRLKSMIKTDVKRMSVSGFFYILLVISFVVPILILVMTTMMDGSVSIDQNGNQTVMQGFSCVWQIFGALPNGAGTENPSAASMDLVSMCNINLMFFAILVLVCIFVTDDFKSGFAKNLFAVRSKNTEYVVSKNIICFLGGACMLVLFFLGSLIGGKVLGLSFAFEGFNALNLLCCMLAKIMLVPVFSSIFVLMSVIAKQKRWLAICLSLGMGMLLFMMIPSLTPLNATAVNVCLCLLGSIMFSFGLGAISKLVLDKTNVV